MQLSSSAWRGKRVRSMSSPFEILAEARIRDWHRRNAAGETEPKTDEARGDSLESQLLQHIVELTEQAAQAQQEERSQLERAAREVETRLMVILESNGLPLAARRIAAELARLRTEKRHCQNR